VGDGRFSNAGDDRPGSIVVVTAEADLAEEHVPASHTAAREFFDRTADDYSERAEARTHDLSSLLFTRRRETVLELLDESGVRGKLLDFGMGPGVLAPSAVERGFEFIGVDISSEMVARAQALGLPRATYVVGDLDTLEGFRGSVDAVLAIGLIDYLEDPVDGLRRLSACLRPGGVLIVSFRNSAALNTLLRGVAKRAWHMFFRRSSWRAESAFVSSVHEKAFSPRTLESALRHFGLNEFSVRYHNATPLLFANVPLARRIWSGWLRLDRPVSRWAPHVLCDAGVLRATKTG
jgi:SAM-dependent methyltransferase